MTQPSPKLLVGLTIAALLASISAIGLAALQHHELNALRAQISEQPPARQAAFQPSDGDSHDERDLARRLRELEAEVGRLRRNAPSAPGSATTGAVANDATADPGKPGSARPAPLPRHDATILSVLESENPQVKARLRDVLRKEMEDLREERRSERDEQRRMQFEARFDEFANKTNLSSSQREELSDMLDAERDEARTIWRAARSGETDRNSAREQTQALREENDNKARELLDEQQYSEYQAMREQDRPGRRGPPRR